MKPFTKKISVLLLAAACSVNATAITDALKVKMTSATHSDETIVRFLAAATPEFDASYDAYKLMSTNPLVPAVFTSIDAESRLSVNALPTLIEQMDIELFTHVKTSGTYTLQSIEIGAFEAGVKIELEDTETGTVYDFRNGNSISVTIDANTLTTANRFIIHFYPVRLSTGIATSTLTNPLLISFQDGGILLNIQAASLLNTEIFIYNISGQKIYHYSNSQLYSLSEHIPLSTTGNYIITSVIDHVVQSKKISYIK